MSFFSNLFGTVPASGDVPAIPTPTVLKSFAEQSIDQLDLLADFIRSASDVLSPAVYSRLRSIDDVIRPMLSYIKSHPLAAESEYAVKALLTDYIPTPLNIFLSLNSSERLDGGRADLLLLEQYDTLELSVRELSQNVYDDVVDSLEVHKIFLQNKFN